MIFLRSLLFNCLFPLVVLFSSFLALVFGIFGGRPGITCAARINGTIIAFLMRTILNLQIEVNGLKNIPDRTDYIVACKHQSAWETMYLHNLIPNPIVIMKRELIYIPLFGQVLWQARSIMINRKKGKSTLPQLIEGAKRSFANGESVFIFPEGTRSAPGKTGKYRYGIAAIYENFNVPVVPIALNSGYFWPRRGFLKYPGTIKVEILPMVEPGLDPAEFLKILEDKIEMASEKLAPAQ